MRTNEQQLRLTFNKFGSRNLFINIFVFVKHVGITSYLLTYLPVKIKGFYYYPMLGVILIGEVKRRGNLVCVP